jgi:hypothetical protein
MGFPSGAANGQDLFKSHVTQFIAQSDFFVLIY